METIAERVKYAREELRIKNGQKKIPQKVLGKMIGSNQQTIGKIENGEILKTRFINEIALSLGVSVTWLMYGGEAPTTIRSTASVKYKPETANHKPIEAASIPIKYIAAGDLQSGIAKPSKDMGVLSWPSSANNLNDVYAVYVSGNSMSPAFKHKDIALVSPYLLIEKGDIVIFIENHSPSLGDKVSIKEFIGESGGYTTFRQINPVNNITIQTDKLKLVHKVLSHQEILG